MSNKVNSSHSFQNNSNNENKSQNKPALKLGEF